MSIRSREISLDQSSGDFLQLLTSNPWFLLVGFVITIIGTLLAVVFYYKSRGTKKIFYISRSNKIVSNISDRLSNLKVLYNDSIVENVTVTKLSIWNGGNSVINASDVSVAAPVTIVLPMEILDFQIDKTVSPTNLISFKKISGCELVMEFDYMGRNEGCILSIIHTATSGKDLGVKGIIKGFGSPMRINSRRFSVLSKLFPKRKPPLQVLIFAIIFVGGALFVSSFFFPDFLNKPTNIKSFDPFYRIFSLFYFFAGIGLAYLVRRRTPKNLTIDSD